MSDIFLASILACDDDGGSDAFSRVSWTAPGYGTISVYTVVATTDAATNAENGRPTSA